MLFHGLEGSSNSHYARALMQHIASLGWSGAVSHFRSCSGELNPDVNLVDTLNGDEFTVFAPVDDAFAMRPEALERAIATDRAAGLRPIAVVASVGTTSTTAIDPVPEIAGRLKAAVLRRGRVRYESFAALDNITGVVMLTFTADGKTLYWVDSHVRDTGALVAQVVYGVEAWTRNADPLGVYFGFFASMAPLTRRDGVLRARPPLVVLRPAGGEAAGVVVGAVPERPRAGRV